MDPSLKVGDRIVVATYERTPKRGAIIVFRNPHPPPGANRRSCSVVDECFVKRVIALGGETLEMRHGVVYIDGTQLSEPYLNPVNDTRDYPPTRVPPGHVFVMGDNRTNSNDSRFGLGPIPDGDIVGTVIKIIRRG
jgi:signal peptidase I